MAESAFPPPRRDRRAGTSSVLTPPTGLPAVPENSPSSRSAAAPSRPSARPAPGPAIPRAAVKPCVCGHGRAAHEHWRRGSDCGICGVAGCASYRRRGGVLRAILRGLGLPA